MGLFSRKKKTNADVSPKAQSDVEEAVTYHVEQQHPRMDEGFGYNNNYNNNQFYDDRQHRFGHGSEKRERSAPPAAAYGGNDYQGTFRNDAGYFDSPHGRNEWHDGHSRGRRRSSSHDLSSMTGMRHNVGHERQRSLSGSTATWNSSSSSRYNDVGVTLGAGGMMMQQPDGTRLTFGMDGKMAITSKDGRQINVSTGNVDGTFCSHHQHASCCHNHAFGSKPCTGGFAAGNVQRQFYGATPGGAAGGTTEVFTTTYPCYDPNCKGGTTCQHFSTSDTMNPNTAFGPQMTSCTQQRPFNIQHQQQPITTTTTYQTTSYGGGGGQSVPQSLQGGMIPGVIGSQGLTIGAREVPMMVGGVPVVIPVSPNNIQMRGRVTQNRALGF